MATISARVALQLRRSSGLGSSEVWRRRTCVESCSRTCSVARTQQRRGLHTAILAPGVGDALAALPGAGKDGRGHVAVPVPDQKLARLAELERTKAVPAVVTAVDVHKDLANELHDAVCAGLNGEKSLPELSGKLLSEVRAADAWALAVPCTPAADPVAYLHATDRLLIESDLHALAQQTCKLGASGPTEEWDVSKLRKALSTSKNPSVRRNADALVKDHLVPGFEELRSLLRSGKPARLGRAGLSDSDAIQPIFEDLARGWINSLITWKPLCVFADVQAAEAAQGASGMKGNDAAVKLQAFAKENGLPCVMLCAALEGEVASLREEAEFLAEYLASFGLREGHEPADGLKPWTSQATVVAKQFPALLNLMTFYTAGEKEARAWQCPRVDREGLPKPYTLYGQGASQSKAGAGKGSKGKESASDLNGIPVPYAASAIHTSFFDKVKGVEVWSYDDLDALGVQASGPAAKDRARSAGKVRKLQVGALVQEGDVVEFLLPS